jgi:hypothetical protein
MMQTVLVEILIALWAIGFTWFAFMFNRLEKRLDAFAAETRDEFKNLRRDLAEEFRAQRAEVAAQVAAIANAIIASRGDGR